MKKSKFVIASEDEVRELTGHPHLFCSDYQLLGSCLSGLLQFDAGIRRSTHDRARDIEAAIVRARESVGEAMDIMASCEMKTI